MHSLKQAILSVFIHVSEFLVQLCSRLLVWTILHVLPYFVRGWRVCSCIQSSSFLSFISSFFLHFDAQTAVNCSVLHALSCLLWQHLRNDSIAVWFEASLADPEAVHCVTCIDSSFCNFCRVTTKLEKLCSWWDICVLPDVVTLKHKTNTSVEESVRLIQRERLYWVILCETGCGCVVRTAHIKLKLIFCSFTMWL